MSLLDSRARFQLRFSEQQDSVLPSDATGHLADPTTPAPLTLPDVVADTLIGFGRAFVRNDLTGLLYEDASDDMRLARALTIVVMARLDLADLADGEICTVIQRGRGGAGDPIPYAMTLERLDATTVKLALAWQTTAGVNVEDPGISFTWPAGEYLLVAATREVVDGELVVRYQVNGESADGYTHALNVGSLAGADVSVGAGMAGASYANHFDGVLDAIEVLNEAVSPEEFEWLWKRISEDMPNGVLTMRRLVPPGVYSQDPSSRVQRELAVEGAALGLAKSLARRRREYGLPAKAWGEQLTKWEELTGNPPKPGDSVAQRRARVLDATQNKRGFNLADIKARLAEPFDLDVADIEILEYDNDFSASDTDSAVVIDGEGTWTGLAFAATAAELGYHGRGEELAGLVLWSLDNGDDAWVHGKVDLGVVDDDVVCGIAIGSRSADEWLFIGVYDDGAARVGYLQYADAAMDSAPTSLGTWASDPTYFRIHHVGDGEYLVKWGTTDLNAKAHAGVAISGGPSAPDWAGFCVVTEGTISGHDAAVTFSDLFIHAPNGRQRFNWYAYRDPGLPGGPNMPAARAEVARRKPAHTNATAILYEAVFCDDEATLTDREPIGA